MIKVGIVTKPLKTEHAVRGVGVYTRNLIQALQALKIAEIKIEPISGEERGYNLIHYPFFDLFSLTLPIKKDSKTVVTIHDVIPLIFSDHYPPGIKGKIKFLIQKFSLRNVKAVITDSQNSKEDIVKYLSFPQQKIFVVYLAPLDKMKKLKKGDWAEEIRKKYFLPEKFVLYVGDVNWNKNVLGLIEACKKLPAPLVIVGKQAAEENFATEHIENQPHFKLLELYGQDPEVKRIGFVPEEDLVKIYNLATVYCQASFYEGFGLPVLEAMACGCPLVVSDCASLKEISANSALFVDPYNINDIAWKLRKAFFNSKLREGLIRKGLLRVEEFSWRKTALKTVKIYEKVANESGNQR